MLPTSRKALVLGGKGGLLGQALAGVLLEQGWSVSTTGRADVDYFASDFSDLLAAKIDEEKPEVIFNTVAYTRVDDAEANEDDAIRLNRAIPAALGHILKSRPVRLVHYSTDFVFDGRKTSPYTVDDKPAPASVYGRTKYEGELALQEAGLDSCCIIRTAWLFGHGKMNFVKKILSICQKNHFANVVFDQIGSPTSTMDLAQHTLALLQVGGTGLFHIVNSGQASWCELADEAVKYSQLECRITPVTSADFVQAAVRPAYSVLDCTRFTQLTGRVPRAWPQALREYLMPDVKKY